LCRSGPQDAKRKMSVGFGATQHFKNLTLQDEGQLDSAIQ
jgi:hypothetical protein